MYLRERRHEGVAVDNPERRGSENNIGRLQKNSVALVHGDVMGKHHWKKSNRT
jgi:hypothetical protein